VSRARLAFVVGIVLLVTACLTPCATFSELAGTSLPYQDPTAEMLQRQAAEVAALERRLGTLAWIAGGLAIAGLVLLIYARCNRQRPDLPDRRL
jgi:hypothetical protein